jgi:CDP-diacylglycerol--glycerol-3-phosphate 3-phosphatidyltransferase
MAILAISAVMTDWLDGFVARRSDSVSEWGKLLDPAADKIGFAAFGAALALSGGIPFWFFLAVAGRDILVAAGGLLVSGRSARIPSANIWGKVSTVILSVYMIHQAVLPARPVLLGLDPLGLAAFAGLVASTASYAFRTAGR